MTDTLNDLTYEELKNISQFGSDFFPHKYGVCAHPHNRPEPYNNAVIGLTSEERVKVAEFVQELRGGMGGNLESTSPLHILNIIT